MLLFLDWACKTNTREQEPHRGLVRFPETTWSVLREIPVPGKFGKVKVIAIIIHLSFWFKLS